VGVVKCASVGWLVADDDKKKVLAPNMGDIDDASNTMKLGTMTAQLPWSLERADLAFCHAGGLEWDARAALAPMGVRAQVADTLDQLLAQVKAVARPGDHLLCMSNGGFGGIHARLLEALKA